MKNNLNITISNLTLSKRAKRDHNLALYPFIKPFLFPQCVLWGCGLYLAHMTFLLSIMHIYLHVEFFSYHTSINTCLFVILEGAAERCCNIIWKPHSWQTYFHVIFISYPSDQYQQCKCLVSARIFATVDCKHLKTLFWMAKCALHFILDCATCISSISLYMTVQNIGNKSFCVYTSCFTLGEDVLRIIFPLRIKCLVSHTV